MLIFSTKTAIGRSIDKSDQTILKMLRNGEVEEVELVTSHGTKKFVGYVLSSKLNKESEQE